MKHPLSREEATQKRVERDKKLVKDISETFATAHGMRTLRYLMEECGYQDCNVSMDRHTGEAQLMNTIFNEGRRKLYLQLRRFVSRETLIAVENKGLEQDDSD